MLSVKQKGNFRRLEKFLHKDYSNIARRTLKKYGELALLALREATPVRTGRTRDSWTYELKKTDTGYSLSWVNNNLNKDGLPIVVLLEYGHGTRSGGYVPAKRFIRKTIRPYLDRIGAIVARNVSRIERPSGVDEEVNDE